jgi:HAD superfamily 5'-nucleotidase-like hydrolase
VLEHLRRQPRLAPAREVFVNRTLRLDSIRYVGFDLDWTLAPYDRDALGELTFDLAVERLVRDFGYPPAIGELRYRPEFSCRGLLIDRQAGTVLKMDRHRYVGTAYLGHHRLDSTERAELYRREPIDMTRQRFYHADTLFELPEVALFNDLVEVRRSRGEPLDPEVVEGLFQHVRTAVDTLHADGTLKDIVARTMGRFLERDPEVAVALARLRLGGKRLFLLTNSEWSFTRSVCSYLLDGLLPGLPEWTDYFDLVVVSAGKPGFFRTSRPFVELDPAGAPAGESEVPQWHRLYAGGCRSGLMGLLESDGETVLYVGDHIYGDVRWTRVSSTWRTALILSELETEVATRGDVGGLDDELLALRDRSRALGFKIDNLRDLLELARQAAGGDDPLAAEPSPFRTILARYRDIRRTLAGVEESIVQRFNSTWGSVFKQAHTRSLFGEQVDDFACVYTSRVSNLGFYGSHHYFRVLADPMRHEIAPAAPTTPTPGVPAP